MSSRPLLSVIVSSFNNLPGLSRAFQSVVYQSYSPIEIVVCDDNSANEQVRGYLRNLWLTRACRVVLGRRSREEKAAVCSFAEQINAGMDACSGEYVSYLCDTDEYLPERCERLVDHLEGNKDVDLAWGMVQNVVNGVPQDVPPFHRLGNREIEDQIRQRNIINHNSAMHRRTLTRWDTGSDSWRRADWLFWLRLLDSGFKFENVEHVGERFYSDRSSMGVMLSEGKTIGDVHDSRK